MTKKEIFIKNTNPVFNNGICHRGLHNMDYSENGMKAFINAMNNGYAFELDVHLSKDNYVVVCHDSNLERMTGVNKAIEELTLEDIKKLRLPDGGEIPTLDEVFSAINEVVPIVVELKVVNNNYKELAKYVKKSLSVIKDKKNIVIISFYPDILREFDGCGYMRQLLIGLVNEDAWELRDEFEGLDLETIMCNQKRVQDYSVDNYINVWTTDSIEKFELCYPYTVTQTFQHLDLEYIKSKLPK